MADIFTGMLMSGGLTFASFERSALTEGHAIMARAMGRALERLDAALCAELPSGLSVHDVRERSLATVVGDVSFRWLFFTSIKFHNSRNFLSLVAR